MAYLHPNQGSQNHDYNNHDSNSLFGSHDLAELELQFHISSESLNSTSGNEKRWHWGPLHDPVIVFFYP